MSYRTAYCAVCASSITSSGSRNRASHSATLGTAIAAALPAHALPIARGSGGSECAHALPRHSPLAPQAPSRPSIRSRNVPPRSSPASADRTASLPPAPYAHRREPRPLTTPATPVCCALTPALPPCFSVMIGCTAPGARMRARIEIDPPERLLIATGANGPADLALGAALCLVAVATEHP
jgi:hypothetical protein